jgi:hypothetical protein
MDVVRKSIGVLIIIFIGIPVLFGVIWAVGVTRAVVSPEFLSDLPQEIIQKIPAMIDEVLAEVDREDMVTDPNERAWVKAVATAKTSPRELLGQIGLTDWMQNELSVKFQQMGKMLRGEIPLEPMTLNLRPLKTALRHEAIKVYLVDLLKNLPPWPRRQRIPGPWKTYRPADPLNWTSKPRPWPSISCANTKSKKSRMKSISLKPTIDFTGDSILCTASRPSPTYFSSSRLSSSCWRR